MAANILVNRRWVRSSEGIFAGVFAGLSKSFSFDAWLLRLVFILLLLLTGLFPGLFFYLLAYICFPREDQLYDVEEKKILGVCYRISRLKKIEVGLVRFLACTCLFLSLGIAVIGYFLLYILLPEEKDIYPS